MTPDSRLLQLPQSSRYAVTAALYLASLPPGGHHVVGRIADSTGLSLSYLAKILQRLATKGILTSRRGVKGGYCLSRPAAEIQLSEIVAASRHAPLCPMPCLIEVKACDGAKPCSMHRFVELAEEALWRQLKATTLAEFTVSPEK